ncbi:MAG: hypothetical protein R3C05_23800 [Pirellulaceae bacterium]
MRLFDGGILLDKCCCHTDAEKLLWAKRNGVTPPAFLVQRAARASLLVDNPVPKRACGRCSAKPTVDAAKTDDQCDRRPVVATEGGKGRPDVEGFGVPRFATFWSMLAAVFVASATTTFSFDSPLVGWIDLPTNALRVVLTSPTRRSHSSTLSVCSLLAASFLRTRRDAFALAFKQPDSVL